MNTPDPSDAPSRFVGHRSTASDEHCALPHRPLDAVGEGVPPERESGLAGARQRGIVRIGDTVRRPPGDSTVLVEHLLVDLEAVGFDGAPRFRGRDEMGREILTFLPGRVARHRPPVGRRRLESVGALVRRFHDATSGSSLTEGREVVCHGELGPHNTLFVRNDAVALIDFDTVHVGSRLDDLDHAAWFFVPLGKDGGTLIEQGQRLRVLCDSYGDCAPEAVLAALAGRFQRVAAWYSERGLQRCEAIFRDSAEWLARHRAPLLAATGRQPRRVPDTDPSTSFG